jgi:Glycosyltransferase family 87
VRKNALLIALVFLFLVGDTVGIYAALTSRKKMHVWDLQPLWQAGRWVVEGRGSPYSDEMTHLLQIESYGRPAQGNEDTRAFVYPLYILLFLLPLLFLPLPWAQAAWFTLLELAAVLGVVGAMRITGWQLSIRRVLLMVAGVLLLYPVTWALALGQVSILIFALMVATLLALRAGWEGWTGVCLALTTAKPQMSFLLVPALLLWAIVQRRYRFLLFFGGTMGVLLLASFAVSPGWLMDAGRAGVNYFGVQPFPPPVALLGETIAGERGWIVTLTLVVLLVAGLAWAWWRERCSQSLPMWAIGFTLVITTLIAPRTSLVNQVMLLFPLLMVLRDLWARDLWGRVVGIGMALAVLVGMCGVRASGIIPAGPQGYKVEHVIMSPILPVALFLAMLALRAMPRWREKPVARVE